MFYLNCRLGSDRCLTYFLVFLFHLQFAVILHIRFYVSLVSCTIRTDCVVLFLFFGVDYTSSFVLLVLFMLLIIVILSAVVPHVSLVCHTTYTSKYLNIFLFQLYLLPQVVLDMSMYVYIFILYITIQVTSYTQVLYCLLYFLILFQLCS